MRAVAIIGTAGRDRGKHYTQDLWEAMYADATERFAFDRQYKLVSGGAAWADHLAVELFLAHPTVFQLELYLPAPLTGKGIYEGDRASAGSASNWYHELFQEATGLDGRQRILLAASEGARIEYEPKAAGMGAFFVRNAKVARAAEACLAYTWGEGTEPADGGTKDTWRQIHGRKVHVPLGRLLV